MDLFNGLPIHPLINHAVAVLVPLSAIGAILVIFVKRFRAAYSPLVLIAVISGAVSAFVAGQSGEALSERVGLPNAHSVQGERLWKLTIVFAILFTIWFVINNYQVVAEKLRNVLQKSFVVLIPIVAVASFGMTFVVGHSGAEATWKNRIAQTQGTALPDAGTTTDASGQPGASGKPGATTGALILSTVEVAKHNTRSDCWSTVKGKVYNLTSYVQSHPGGASVIANICGKDGSGAFSNQHGTASKPNNTLDGFLLGTVGSSISSQASQKLIAPPASSGSGEGDEEGEESEEREEGNESGEKN
jgi:cytochrome b involved in lipid metabolism